MPEPSKFHQAVEKILVQRLSSFKDQKPSSSVCLEIYTTIFETLVELFQHSSMKITNESANYVAQQYYDAVTINENSELDPNIFEKRASLKNIETKELALLAMMLNGTDFCPPILYEIKRRS